MRDIKFRAYDPKNKKMMYESSDCHIILYLGSAFIEIPSFNTYIIVNHNYGELIPMQYTAIKDDKEKEIYEGDIVIPIVLGEEQGKCVVSYSEERAAYIIRDIDNKYIEEDIDNFCSYQVIGNIYENPELLEPEE